jgi:hypothetical protein
MSILRTVADLRADALFRSGESPTDTTGSFYAKTLEYLNRIQQTLLLGGSVSGGRDLATSAGIYAHIVDLPITDWWWARKTGIFNTKATLATTITVGLNPGDTSVSLQSSNLTECAGYYIIFTGRSTVLRATSFGSTTAILNFDAPYPDDAIAAGGQVNVVKMEYDLPGDFIRFSNAPYVHSFFGTSVDVSSVGQRNLEWPVSIIRQGRPTRSFRTDQRKITVNAYDTKAYRVEFEYVPMFTDIVEGGAIAVPEQHRQVLASGAAMLISFDKDDGRAANLASEYRELVARMVQEHRRAMGGGSSTFGQIRPRQYSIVKRSPQTFGELFLI